MSLHNSSSISPFLPLISFQAMQLSLLHNLYYCLLYYYCQATPLSLLSSYVITQILLPLLCNASIAFLASYNIISHIYRLFRVMSLHSSCCLYIAFLFSYTTIAFLCRQCRYRFYTIYPITSYTGIAFIARQCY